MPVYKWRKRESQHFGPVWTPFAQIELSKQGGGSQRFAVQIDTGAVVSLLRRSVADVLGLDYKSGRCVELGSVGGAKTVAHVHHIPTKFDEHLTQNVPYAIAEREDVPNLLGRHRALELLQLNLDATLAEATLSRQWLSPTQTRIWTRLRDAEREILRQWSQAELIEPVKVAVKAFVDRAGQLLAGAMGLVQLRRTFSNPPILRSLFEVSIQFDYMVADVENRAKQYLDFAHVSKHRMAEEFVRWSRGPITSFVAASEQRPEGEERNRQAFERVRQRFATANGNTHATWYCSNLRELAREVGREGEYVVVYKRTSAWTHADPFTTSRVSVNSFGGSDVAFGLGLGYYAGMLRSMIALAGIGLSADDHQLLDNLRTDWAS